MTHFPRKAELMVVRHANDNTAEAEGNRRDESTKEAL